MEKRKKTVYQLDTPYSAVSWPTVTLEDQDTILELLCNLLAPLGQYRSEYVELSKGKRDKKRKRKVTTTQSESIAPPPAPELKSYVDVGIVTVTRHLQELASQTQAKKTNSDNKPVTQDAAHDFYSAIFVARSGPPNTLHRHLPQAVAIASKAHPEQTPVRLVGLSKPCDDRLSEALGIPRVSCIGIREGAPDSKALVEFIVKHVPSVEIQWMEEAKKAEYKATNINAIETFVGTKKQHNRGLPV
ncbi:hypothetical protein F4774DRAFT_364956 [Daldinia eschscholtzii]|nr:hypothetical protein F4774DRAFT_364956 [Daldinia eschscholtzii]